jgi:hypothetical protein
MCDSSDFGLDNPKINRTIAKQCFDTKVSELDELNPDTTKYHCLKSRKDHDVTISLIDRETKTLVFYSYLIEVNNPDGPGYGITQISVWRATSDTNTVGMANRVFNYVLDKFGTVISDDIHTPEGKEFWKRQMIDADSKSYPLGLINDETGVTDWKQSESVQDWLKDRDEAWGWDKSHLRFIIKRAKLESY